MTQLKVASYNIHKAVGVDRRYDPARVLRVLAELDPDVAVLQEADRRLGPRPSALPRALIAQETDFNVVNLARNDVSLGWHGNAVLVRKDLPVQDVQHIDLPGLEPRGAVMAQIEGVRIVGTHLGLLRYWRQQQMNTILELVRDDSSRTLIVGDFNEWSPSLGFEPWIDHFSILRPGRSFHARRLVAELDRMAYGAGLEVSACDVFRGHFSHIASDHMPIWADIVVKP